MIRIALVAAILAAGVTFVTPSPAEAQVSASSLYQRWAARVSVLRRTGGGGTNVSPN